MRRRRVPLRHSLVTRLLVTSVVVAVLAVAATAWLATRTATQAIRQEQGRSLAEEKALYDALIGYAATHREWDGVGGLLEERSQRVGRRITLADRNGRLLADTADGPRPQIRASAIVDPLRLDLTLTGAGSLIDERAVGPYRITGREARTLRKGARDMVSCLASSGIDSSLVEAPSGRPMAEVTGSLDGKRAEALSACQARIPSDVVPTERRALRRLSRLTAECLDRPVSELLPEPQDSTRRSSAVLDAADWYDVSPRAELDECLDQARRTQLRPFTAEPALLYITDPDTGLAGTTFTLSRPNILRIVTVTGAVLLVTVLVTVLAGRRMVRPLRALTEGAARQEPVAVRTRDEIGYLAAALNEATERRDRAEALRRAMVGDVAHELRNPLTNIRSWLEAAQDGLAPTDRQLVDLLHEETLLLQHVIADLADLAAADAGTLRLHPEPVDLREILDRVLDAHLSPAEDAGVALLVAVPGESQELSADPVRLRQLIGNLISNGVRYTPRGGSVTVTAATSPAGSTIVVQDTGIGIAVEHLPRVFERFWRADDSRARATGGSGLGLPIARQIAEAHGGTITVSSVPGQGTTFTVELPVRQPADPAEPVALSPGQ